MNKADMNERKAFYKAILSLETEKDCEAFFEDILTPNELLSIPQRLKVAELLSRGESFVNISAETGASTATIGRVSRCLKMGPGGYKFVLEKLNEKKKA